MPPAAHIPRSDNSSQSVRQVAPALYTVTPEPRPRDTLERIRELVLGPPLPSRLQTAERLGILGAVALIGSDMIASSVYGPEEMILRLGEAGRGGVALAFPVSLGIGVLLAVLAVSYLQTIRAYPRGAGGYIVASDNFGPFLGIVGAAALLIDYTLDVAVSIATGVQSITSALPDLASARVWLCLLALMIITLANLRGIRTAGVVLSTPVYVYIIGTLGVLVFGIVLAARGGLPQYTPPDTAQGLANTTAAIGVVLLLRAFASGAVALTGIEAISDGVPYLKQPETKNAQRALVIMAALFAAMFLGIGFLAGQFGVIADTSEVETVHSQITRTLVGRGPVFVIVEISAMLMLILAANTGFADFPRLLALLARDKYLPGAFATRGSRLGFSNGILMVAGMSALLLIAFQGSLNGLAPLFTIGAFLTFTLSQAGMVRYHWKRQEQGWHWRMGANAVGAATTLSVLAIVLASKFLDGAWLIVVCLPVLVHVLHTLGTHHQRLIARAAISPDRAEHFVEAVAKRTHHCVLVPVAVADRVTLNTMAYILSLVGESPTDGVVQPEQPRPVIQAVHITDDRKTGQRLQRDWHALGLTVPLVVLESPNRAAAPTLLQYIGFLQHQSGIRTVVTVAIPETVPTRWWHPLVRNYFASRLKLTLMSRPGVTVLSVPLAVQD
ncbi:MAG: APC family permease [Chloroflexota bacterium]|nr:APC family permease [Chloroflexota bacterium]